MFNLTLPTDSLYKFAFVFGLLMVVFSFYYKDKNLSRSDKNQILYKLDSLMLYEESHYPTPTFVEDQDSINRIELNKLLAYSTKKDSSKIKSYKFQISLNRQIKLYRTEKDLNNLYFNVLLQVGFFLFFCGTILWYSKVQRLQDRLLEMQVRQMENELDGGQSGKERPTLESSIEGKEN
jgi:hypothetical protein